jgi:hypothetical protein
MECIITTSKDPGWPLDKVYIYLRIGDSVGIETVMMTRLSSVRFRSLVNEAEKQELKGVCCEIFTTYVHQNAVCARPTKFRHLVSLP